MQKTANFWGLFGEIEVKKEHLLAKKAGGKAIFLVREGKLAVTEGFSGLKRTLCHKQPPPRVPFGTS